MEPFRNLRLLDAAEQLSHDVAQLIDATPNKLLHVAQLTRSAQSVPANISEGFGDGSIKKRNDRLRTARGSAEETVRHLKPNLSTGRISSATFWRIRNRCVVITKMIDAIIDA